MISRFIETSAYVLAVVVMGLTYAYCMLSVAGTNWV